MALSKPSMTSLGTPQYFLECDVNDCERNCQFYCNPCHQRMCEQCRREHLKNPEYMNHEVVPYQKRKRQLPVEKCKIHPTKDLDILCDECQVPLCSRCATQNDHKGHEFIDLETIYADKMALCLEKISNVQKHFLPTSQDLQKEIKGDAAEIKMIMDSIRTAIKADGETLKCMVDTLVSENMQELENIERSLLETLNSQDETLADYISYLHDRVKIFHEYLSFSKLTELLPNLSEKCLKIQPIPETTKPVTPVFTAGEYSKDDLAKFVGNINVTNTKAEMRKTKLTESVARSKSGESSNKQKTHGRHKNHDVTETMSLSYSVTKVREFNVPGLNSACHISQDKSGRLLVSDWGILIQSDLQGNQLQKIQTNGEDEGYYTVTPDGDLMFTDKKKIKINKKISPWNTVTEFLKIRDWEPISIHSSHINGDILVGMRKDGEAKVTRYNKTGKELQSIQREEQGQELYDWPNYITENINEDVCVSDYYKHAVVVVNKSGQHRFSYTGQQSELFSPFGICTDVLGHILVCDDNSKTVHLLDQDGQFMSLLLTKEQGVEYPRCVCVDGENNIYVGQWYINTVTVFKYLM